MTESEKKTELSNLIAVLKQEGMPYPMTFGIAVGPELNTVLGDCRRLVKMARKAGR
jgi:hypothetical protein